MFSAISEKSQFQKNDKKLHGLNHLFLILTTPPPLTRQSELEVQKIIHLQNLSNRLSDAFIDSIKVTKSHILAANIPARIEIPMGKLKYRVANEPKPQLKRGKPIGSKDTIPRKRKSVKFNALEEHAPEDHTNVKGLNDELRTPAEASIEQLSHEIIPIHNNEEISINYIHKGKIWIEILPLYMMFFLSKWLWTS